MKFITTISASILFFIATSQSFAMDEKEIMLRAITVVDICNSSGDASSIALLSFSAGIDMSNLTDAQKTIVTQTKALYKKLPASMRVKVCEQGKEVVAKLTQ